MANYTGRDLRADAIAGLTVAVMGVPQAMAYAMIADLPPTAATGWKNFYDEDRPTPTPAQTLAVTPRPIYVSYQ